MPLSLAQSSIVTAPQRFKVVVAGRRFGKTHLAIRELCRHARLPDQTVWYVAPTYKQAKMIAFKALKRKLMDLRWAKKINETELSFELKNGSIIALKGADNYDSLRGIGLDYLVLDEFADIDQEAWTETLRPTLSDREGGALFIGTPKGMNWAHDLYTMFEDYPDEWASFQYTTIEGGNVKPEEVEAARRSLDERTFRQEFEATFETFSGRIFYAFDRANNLRTWQTELPANLHVGLDFNVDNNSAVIAVRVNQDQLHIIDEIKLMGSNTDEMVQELKTRFPKNNITVYPDPAGAARKTSAGGRTDHSILRTAGFTVKAPNSHNAVRDGINAVNARLKSSTGIINLFVDPRCKYTIESLEKHTYKPDSSVPDKDSGFDHFSDAIRYMVDYLFPIRGQVTPPPTRMWSHKLG
jgi:hypothetical protein